MKRIILSLFIIGVCWGGHAINKQQIKDILKGLEGITGAPVNRAAAIAGALGLPLADTQEKIGTLNRILDNFKKSGEIDPSDLDYIIGEPRINHVPSPDASLVTGLEQTPNPSATPSSTTLPKRIPPPIAPRPRRVVSADQDSSTGLTPQSSQFAPPINTAERRLFAQSSASRNSLSPQQGDWLRNTLLIGTHREAVAGFEGVSDRLQVFNPLYNQAFPNVPIPHQYDPLTSPVGGFFPLVVKLDSFNPILPEVVVQQFHPSSIHDIYWVVQSIGSINAIGQGPGDNLVFRPHYWVFPSGQSATFHADVRLLDPQGTHHHLPTVGYSIHDGVASPNSPTIPFQEQLKSGESLSFWSFTTYGPRTALTYHWFLGGNDITQLGTIISSSSSVNELLIHLNQRRTRFTNWKIIDEVESIFGQA